MKDLAAWLGAGLLMVSLAYCADPVDIGGPMVSEDYHMPDPRR